MSDPMRATHPIRALLQLKYLRSPEVGPGTTTLQSVGQSRHLAVDQNFVSLKKKTALNTNYTRCVYCILILLLLLLLLCYTSAP